jgi:hypothetical protein
MKGRSLPPTRNKKKQEILKIKSLLQQTTRKNVIFVKTRSTYDLYLKIDKLIGSLQASFWFEGKVNNIAEYEAKVRKMKEVEK